MDTFPTIPSSTPAKNTTGPVDWRFEYALAKAALKHYPSFSILPSFSPRPPPPARKATKAAEAAALHRLRALTSASARALSASWFSLLGRASGTAAHGGHGHGKDGFADGHAGGGGGGGEGVASAGVTVPVIAVRRLLQSCGILQGTAGAPTLAHADMELQRSSVGKRGRSIGHSEVMIGIYLNVNIL